jgi:hypothetical protein
MHVAAAVMGSFPLADPSKAPAIDFFHPEGVRVDSVDTPDIDSGHFRAGLWVRADGE